VRIHFSLLSEFEIKDAVKTLLSEFEIKDTFHTIPSKVAVGNTFGLRGIVFNNSTATITFGNGTCTSPLSIIFNKNVMMEPQATTASCSATSYSKAWGTVSYTESKSLRNNI
jgi:hypothetical protein